MGGRRYSSPEQQFWSHVDRRSDDECWLWLLKPDAAGYGRMTVGGRAGYTVKAHRFAYELLVGPIPDGLVIDHLCRAPMCVNPRHMEPVTAGENCTRAPYFQAHLAKVECPRGHPYDDENTYRRKDGSRGCRECGRQRYRRRYAEGWRRPSRASRDT